MESPIGDPILGPLLRLFPPIFGFLPSLPSLSRPSLPAPGSVMEVMGWGWLGDSPLLPAARHQCGTAALSAPLQAHRSQLSPLFPCCREFSVPIRPTTGPPMGLTAADAAGSSCACRGCLQGPSPASSLCSCLQNAALIKQMLMHSLNLSAPCA